MLFKTQFIKYALCVILYILVCSFLFTIRQSFYLKRRHSIFFIKPNETKEKCSMMPRVITNPINVEIKFLERDAMEGESINLQEITTVLRQISNVCVKYDLKTPLIRKHFLYNSQHKSMYCWIRKIASTSFTKLFADMKNRPPTQKYYREVDILAPRSQKELQFILNDTNTFKFLIVRHPFQRLVSSYRDRIEDNTKYTAQSWIYVKKIFRITRPKLFRSTNFQQKVFAPDKRLKIIPSFKEFLEWLLQSAEEDDVHWDSYYMHCAVCTIRYNYVLKLDDYTYGEINYIFSKLGLDKTKVYLPTLEKTRGGNTNFDTTCRYFANLTEDIILRLYEKYKIDFEMYNYDFNRYLNCINKKIHK